ncbi:MAG: hypothetical protein HYU88_01080 [Chloroflexi bacterium]|nr:hypothetical protein [Chloroflexota bacterium]MBI4504369.1 hypothetical protein [Chloroflexota bacterium]
MTAVRLAGVLVATLAAVYGYVTLMLVVLGQTDGATWPALAASAGSLALVALRVQHPPAGGRRAGRRQVVLLSTQVALALGVAAWAGTSALLDWLQWPPSAALGAGELAGCVVAASTWPAARRFARRAMGAEALRDGSGRADETCTR